MQILGSTTKRQKRLFERTFRYLGYSTSWSLGLLLFTFYMLSAISFLTDAVQTANFNWLWFLVSGAAFLPPFAIAASYRFFYLERRKERSRPWLNLLVAGLAGSSRNLGVGLFSLWSGLDDSSLWLFRFAGGFLMGIAIYTIWAFLDGARIEYLGSLRHLADTQSDLAATRLQMPEQIASTNEGLQQRTKQALFPQLAAIKELLASFSDSSEVVEHLRYTITEQIRPMMQEISRDQPKPFQTRNIRQYRNISAALPARFILHDKLMVTWSSIIELIGLSMWLIVLGSKNGLLDIVALFAIYFTVMSIFKYILPNGMQFKRATAVVLTSFFAFTASLAEIAYIHFVLDYPFLQFLMFAGFAVLSGVIGPVVLLQVSVRNERRTEIEKQIAGDLHAIAKENSLFAQRLWVFRKRWLLILHGNVQSSLTAALTRLESAEKVDAVLLELVMQDLRRAELAVESNLTEPVNLANGILELKAVWQGICDVRVNISERAKRALEQRDDSAFCVNEILKEAVSNAVRHGDANEAVVTVDRVTDDILHIEVANNGTVPAKSSENRGIGSDLLNEVCLSWSLETENKLVRLAAELPVKL